MAQFEAYFRQTLAATAAGVNIMMVASSVGWTAPILKRLEANGSEIPITPEQGSWLAAYHEVGHIISPIPTGYFVDVWGRKPFLVLSAGLFIVAWLLVFFTRLLSVLYVVRFIFGVCMGISFTVVPMYIAEISQPKLRGRLLTLFPIFLQIGHILEFSIGPYLSYDNIAIISMMVPVTFLFISLYWLEESPYFFVIKKQLTRARGNFAYFRGEEESSQEDNFEEFKDTVLEEITNKTSYISLLTDHTNRKSLLIVVLLSFAQRFTGMSAIVAYSARNFPSNSFLSSAQYTILFGVLTLVFTCFSTFFIDKFGRKPLILTSCIGSGIAEILAGVLYFLHDKKEVSIPYYSWFIFTCISTYACLYAIGLGTVSSTIQGELFSTNVRGSASSIASIAFAIASFTVTKSFQTIEKHFGIYTNFWFYSFDCFVTALLVYKILPETKERSLHDIQKLLKSTN